MRAGLFFVLYRPSSLIVCNSGNVVLCSASLWLVQNTLTGNKKNAQRFPTIPTISAIVCRVLYCEPLARTKERRRCQSIASISLTKTPSDSSDSKFSLIVFNRLTKKLSQVIPAIPSQFVLNNHKPNGYKKIVCNCM